ncbi:transcriptional regulator MelR [Volucribacter amazonae]|nr:transcriptional regulator MelR [Volucribacter amazonae]
MLKKKTRTENVSAEQISPLSLYAESLPLHIDLQQPPEAMPAYHWHGQIEINIPFDDKVEYIFNGHNIELKANHITLFWATIPHRLVERYRCQNMAVLDIPIQQFLAWTLPKEFINQITYGQVIQSKQANLVSLFEIKRWLVELKLPQMSRHQLVCDEVQLMVRRMALDGWQTLLNNKTLCLNTTGASRHTQHYVNVMLSYIAKHYNQSLTVEQVASAVGLNANYAMSLFQAVMKLTIKQYITSMRINHAKALLSDTERSISDISSTAGFSSLSRFYDNFQKMVGISPKQYRKLIRSNERWSVNGIKPTQFNEKGASDGHHLLSHYAKEID